MPGRHRRGCPHCARWRDMVDAYRCAREAAVLQREAVCYGYDSEEREYGPLVTFKDWLEGYARSA